MSVSVRQMLFRAIRSRDRSARSAFVDYLLESGDEAGAERVRLGLWPYYVVSPEYGEVVPVTDDGQGPMEYGRDVVEVEATSKRTAILAGVKAMRAHPYRFRHLRHCEGNPFTGVRAELAVCDHGRPHFVLREGRAERVECAECWAELEARAMALDRGRAE